MSSVPIFVIDVLWPAIVAALIVEWVKGHVLRSPGEAHRREGKQDPAMRYASVEVRLSLVCHIQCVDDESSEPRDDWSYRQRIRGRDVRGP